MWWIFLAGSLGGLALGFLTAVAGLRWLQGARERRAVQALITQVHLKRALAEDGPGMVESASDALRCRSAVVDVRLQIRETLSELRPGSSAAAHALLAMHGACDTYLRAAERPGGSVQARLRELRLVLNQGVRRLSSGRHVQYLAPGQRAAVRREMLLAAARSKAARAKAAGAGTLSAKNEARRSSAALTPESSVSPAAVPGPRRAALQESARMSAEAAAHARTARTARTGRRLVDHSDARLPL